MSKKPTYDELEKRIHEFEKEELTVKGGAFLQRLIDTIPSPIFFKDLKGKYLGGNREWAEKVIGLPIEKIIGRTAYELAANFSEEQVNEFQEHDAYVLKNKETLVYEGIVNCADGILRNFVINRAPFYDGDGNTAGTIGTMTDVTERKRAMDDLQRSEERWHGIIENAAIGIYQVNDQGKFDLVNSKFAHTFGYESPADFLACVKEAAELYVHQEDRAPILQEIDTKGFVNGAEAQCRHKDGKTIWVMITARAIKDASNRTIYEGFLENITERKLIEEKILRFARIFEDSINEIYLFNPDTLKFIQVNRSAQQNLGYTMDELQGMTPLDLKPEITSESFAKLTEPLRKGEKKKVVFETVHKRKDQSLYDAEVHLQLLKQDHEGVFAAIILDTTERKNTMEALWESESKYKTLTENSIAGIFIHQDNKYVYVNEKFAEMHGYEPEELLGKDHTELIHPDQKELIKERSRRRLKGEQVPKQYEIKRLHKNGRVAWHEIMVGDPIVYDGKPAIMGHEIDITDRKQAEKELKESELWVRNIFKSLNEAVFVITLDRRFVDMNETVEKMFGYTREELLNLSSETVHVDRKHFLKFGEEMAKVVDKGEVTDIRYEMKRKNGDIFPTEHTASLMVDNDGKPLGIVSVVSDLSKQKQVEEEKQKLHAQLIQAQKMESIGTLTGGIAHDFNNILGIIIGNTELALEEVPETNPAHFSLTEIKTAGQRAADIVKQLLSFSRKTDRELIPIDLNMVINDILKLLRATIPTTIEIREKNLATNDTILGGPTQINQMIMNLCINASQEMEKTGGILDVIVENVTLDKEATGSLPDLRSGDYVKVTVADTGPGIDPESIEKIFDPYFTTKEVGKGSGMGLAVVHGIVKNHKGAITVESKPGKGTRFNVFFPSSTLTSKVEFETESELPYGNETVLLVDDEESVLNVIGQILERLGYQVESRSNPVEALDLFQSKPDEFDLVVTDMTMPQMTGVALSEKLMEIRPAIPIIICTGHSSLVDAETAKDKGIAAYVLKPIVSKEMAKTMRKVLDNEKEAQTAGRILVIDDEPQMRKLLKTMLEEQGYDVVEASDGKEGIKRYRENPTELIITDLIMPEKEGIEVIMELRKDFPEVKIIAISGGGRNEPESYLQMAKGLGAARVLPKPIGRVELMEAVGELFK